MAGMGGHAGDDADIHGRAGVGQRAHRPIVQGVGTGMAQMRQRGLALGNLHHYSPVARGLLHLPGKRRLLLGQGVQPLLRAIEVGLGGA